MKTRPFSVVGARNIGFEILRLTAYGLNDQFTCSSNVGRPGVSR